MSGQAERQRLDQAAVSSTNLSGRIDANTRYAGADFDGWVRGLINTLPGRHVLDMCCGTGNQMIIHAARPECETLVGVDRSTDSLATARQRVGETGFRGTLDLLDVPMDGAFEQDALSGRMFDQISCCYGLYYADDPIGLLDGMLAHLSPGGGVLIVGPWGDNNKSLFDLLRRHITLPPLVERSATTFMTEEVQAHLDGRAAIRIETFVNPVSYPDLDSVLTYWRKTTFYDADKEPAFRRDLESHFATSDAFVVEKHVMGLIATR